MDFYLTLPSNVIGEGNLIGNYITTLNKPLILEGEWEVGICDITYVNTIPNVPKGSIIKTSEKGEIIKERDFNFSFYKNIEALKKDIEINFDVQFTKDGIIDRYQKEAANVLIVKGNDFARVIGFGKLTDGRYYLTNIKDNNIIDKVQPKPLEEKKHLFVLCDLIHEQHYGDRKVPLIRSLPIEGIYGDVVYKEFTHVRYFSLVSNYISTIHIQLKDKELAHVPFIYGKTVITLHLRKKNGYNASGI